MAKAEAKTTVLPDGLRYKSKVSGSPFMAAASFGGATMSCFLCGKHRARSLMGTRKVLGKSQAVCSPSCKALDEAIAGSWVNKHKSVGNDWAVRVWGLVRGGNSAAAISQIKAAASLKDVQQLRKLMDAEPVQAKSSAATVTVQLSQVVDDQINALSHPRLHRSP